jgi:hypothetical protein
MLRVCICCSRPAQYSLALVLSTVGISRRMQQCSKVMLFCDLCIQKLCNSEHYASHELRERVNSVYTALNIRSGEGC